MPMGKFLPPAILNLNLNSLLERALVVRIENYSAQIDAPWWESRFSFPFTVAHVGFGQQR